MRADLAQYYHTDLASLVAAHRWKALIELVDQLPGASRVNERIVTDPTLAAQIAAEADEAGVNLSGGRPPVREETPELGMLRQIANLLMLANSDPKKKPDLLQAPKTEIADALADRRRQVAEDLIARLAPHAAHQL